MFEKIGKCTYCKDPIYKGREVVTVGSKKYHAGCHRIMEKESKPTTE